MWVFHKMDWIHLRWILTLHKPSLFEADRWIDDCPQTDSKKKDGQTDWQIRQADTSHTNKQEFHIKRQTTSFDPPLWKLFDKWRKKPCRWFKISNQNENFLYVNPNRRFQCSISCALSLQYWRNRHTNKGGLNTSERGVHPCNCPFCSMPTMPDIKQYRRTEWIPREVINYLWWILAWILVVNCRSNCGI